MRSRASFGSISLILFLLCGSPVSKRASSSFGWSGASFGSLVFLLHNTFLHQSQHSFSSPTNHYIILHPSDIRLWPTNLTLERRLGRCARRSRRPSGVILGMGRPTPFNLMIQCSAAKKVWQSVSKWLNTDLASFDRPQDVLQFTDSLFGVADKHKVVEVEVAKCKGSGRVALGDG